MKTFNLIRKRYEEERLDEEEKHWCDSDAISWDDDPGIDWEHECICHSHEDQIEDQINEEIPF